MAGRPRTMLKRVADWFERAERLYDEIDAAMPDQYKNHDVNKYRPGVNRFDLLFDLRKRDPVAAKWIEAHDDAVGLTVNLGELAEEIERRARRKGLLPEPGKQADAGADSPMQSVGATGPPAG